MQKFYFKNSKFIKTAIKPKDYPILRCSSGQHFPEIAVVGRSNVGKSSLLNHLFRTKNLVKTSSTPGKTQALNFFSIDEELVFVDLPGYGFAKVPTSVRKQWGPMVQSYLDSRDPLKLILFLFDIRRMPNEEDFKLLDWIAHREIATILVLTKTDKLKRNEKVKNTKNILEAFAAEQLHHVHYSVPKNIGRQTLIAMMKDAFEDERG